jgi:hypothetical protein
MTKAVDYDPSKNAMLWFVVFSRSSSYLTPWWVRLFTRNNFQHCYAFRDYHGITLIVNHVAQGLLIDATNVKARDCARAWAADKGDTVVLFASQLKPRYTPRGVQTCVSVVKSVIGLGAPRILTPQQLYQYLIDNGGVVLWAEKGGKSKPANQNAEPSTCANKTNSPSKSS